MQRGDDAAAKRLPAPENVVQEVVDGYLNAVDVDAPGLVEGLYLVGSVALSDFCPHESDIDFVAATKARPGAAALGALEGVHDMLRARYRRPHFDGFYVTWGDLSHDPALAVGAPSAHEGSVKPEASGLDPVTWHTLARHGVAVRGPSPAGLDVWTDPTGLSTWTLGNLDSYWRPWRERSARLFSKAGLAMLGSWAPAWGVLGVSRLHYTLSTGEITSKTGAGLYALDTFPARWHRVVNECLRIRRGGEGRSLYHSRMARRGDALAYMDMVINDVQRSAPVR